MHFFDNRHRRAERRTAPSDIAPVSVDAVPVLELIQRCPVYAATPLRDEPALAALLGVESVRLKDERERMGLGSFKALGAAFAIASEAVRSQPATLAGHNLSTALSGRTFVCASAGNHGLSVAAGARIFGASAVVYLSDAVPAEFSDRVAAMGATVVRQGCTYEESMAAAKAAAEREGWVLLADSSWPGYAEWPRRVMEGYLVLAHEIVTSIADTPKPTHVFLQAGVGGMAAAVAAYLRSAYGNAPLIVVVEPDRAPCLLESARAGRPVSVSGDTSTMGRLDCKEPSEIAVASLAIDADFFVAISDATADKMTRWLAERGIATTASGAAGLAVAWSARDFPGRLDLNAQSRVLAILTE